MKYPILPVAASELGADVSGDASAVADHVANLDNAGDGCLAFCLASRLDDLAGSRAAVVLAPAGARDRAGECGARAVVWVDNPMAVFVDLLARNGCANGPSAGSMTVGGWFLADDAEIGPDTEVFPQAAIHDGVVVGAGCRIQSGAVLGAVGLGYAATDDGYERFPHLGRLVVGDNVDIGAGAVLVRGILQDTVIGSGTRIGGQVNIGHNVTVGRNCFISAGAVLAGSAVVEDWAWIAPNATVLNGVTVGAGARLAPGAVLSRDAKAGHLYAGNPARVVKKL